jgi:hypothetical protein
VHCLPAAQNGCLRAKETGEKKKIGNFFFIHPHGVRSPLVTVNHGERWEKIKRKKKLWGCGEVLFLGDELGKIN